LIFEIITNFTYLILDLFLQLSKKSITIKRIIYEADVRY